MVQPSRSGAVDCVNFFQRYIDVMTISLPFIKRLEINELLNEAITFQEAGNIEDMTIQTPDKLVITYIAVANGMLLSPTYAFTELFSTEFVMKAVQLMSRVLEHSEELLIVRCLTALTIVSLITPLGGSTWHLLGLAMTRSVSYGIHTARAGDLDSEDEEKVQMDRVFGSCTPSTRKLRSVSVQ
jgi:hypothetical protein